MTAQIELYPILTQKTLPLKKGKTQDSISPLQMSTLCETNSDLQFSISANIQIVKWKNLFLPTSMV